MSSPNEEKYPPACDICGGGEVIDGLVVWGLNDPKLDEHAKHDISPVWDHTRIVGVARRCHATVRRGSEC
jgi:hypothetical protein